MSCGAWKERGLGAGLVIRTATILSRDIVQMASSLLTEAHEVRVVIADLFRLRP